MGSLGAAYQLRKALRTRNRISPDVSPKPDSGKVQPFARMMNLASKLRLTPQATTRKVTAEAMIPPSRLGRGGLARTKTAERDPAAPSELRRAPPVVWHRRAVRGRGRRVPCAAPAASLYVCGLKKLTQLVTQLARCALPVSH